MALQQVATSVVLKGAYRKERAWELVADFTRYPEIMENVDQVTLRERNDKEGVSEWAVSVEGAPLSWMEKDHYDREGYKITFESINGDFETFGGRWKIENFKHEGIRISFDVKYDLGIPVIEEVLGDILRKKMKANIDAMIHAIKAELEKEQIEQRAFRRYPVDASHTLKINETEVCATIVNVSRGGMMILHDGRINVVNAAVKIHGISVNAEIIMNDIKQKNYRIRFNRQLDRNELDGIVALFTRGTLRVQEAVIVEKQYETAVNS